MQTHDKRLLRQKLFQQLSYESCRNYNALLTFLAKVMSNIPPTSNCDCMKGQGLVGVSTNLEKGFSNEILMYKILLMFQGECVLVNDMLEEVGISVLKICGDSTKKIIKL